MCQEHPAVQVLHQGPVAPQTLNKYNVLPSIRRRQPEVRGLEEHVSKLHLCGGPQVCLHSEGAHPPPHPAGVPPHPDTKGGSSSAGVTGSLLVAVRTPCGERFEQLFDPTDDLRMVRVSAEARYGTQYGEVSIKSMDVPSRTFTDMDQTLAQCGIVNRSVLCIMENDSYNIHTSQRHTSPFDVPFQKPTTPRK